MKAIPLFADEPQLPTVVSDLTLEGVEYFPDSNLGVRIRYGTPTTAKVDVFLYDLGLADIPYDLRSPQVRKWFQESVQGVIFAAKQGLYVDFEVLASQYLHLPLDAPDPFCLWASFAYRQVPGKDIPMVSFAGRRVSNMALRTDRGYINKIRYTYPENAGEEGFAGFLAFLVEWHGHVQLAPGVT